MAGESWVIAHTVCGLGAFPHAWLQKERSSPLTPFNLALWICWGRCAAVVDGWITLMVILPMSEEVSSAAWIRPTGKEIFLT